MATTPLEPVAQAIGGVMSFVGIVLWIIAGVVALIITIILYKVIKKLLRRKRK